MKTNSTKKKFFCKNLFLLIIFIEINKTSQNNEVNSDIYDIGVGIADITGQAADVGMMGYAKNSQETQGIHSRLFARTFIISDNNSNRIVYISCDLAMISTIVKLEVINSLKPLYGDLYNHNNVMIASTHTHSGPGGFLQYVLYIITSQGFNKNNFQIIVSGILRSIYRAHSSMKKGFILYNEGELIGASINRSPTSYLSNSETERKLYNHNTDQTMKLLKFITINNDPLGTIAWFSVHCTSMNNSNHLISGDNKGYASLLFEQQMNPNFMPGKGSFVAAFPNSNEGDVSPNTKGPRCIDTGFMCDIETSSCPDIKGLINRQSTAKVQKTNEKCIASGPGKDMFESTKIIGQMQYAKAKILFDTAKLKLSGPVRYIHKFVDMSNQPIYNKKSEVIGRTCPPAMGYSFAAGTTDGPGAFDFTQGAKSSTPFWNLVRDFIRRPSEQLMQCHKPKPILLATGEMSFPYKWQPEIIPIQLLSIGNLFSNKKGSLIIAGLPGEFTTMAGRRLRNRIFKILDEGITNKTKITPVNNINNFLDEPSKTFQSKKFYKDSLSRRQKRFINFYKYFPINRNLYSNSYLMQNQPIQINDNSARNEEQLLLAINKNFDHFNETIEDAIYKNENTETLGTGSYLNVNRVILSGLTNTYSSYITTFEEYQQQRYEAASTVYGPYTLQAYIQHFSELTYKLIDYNVGLLKTDFPKDSIKPPNLLSKQIQLKPGVFYDGVKFNSNFGDLILDVKPVYKLGELVKVIFHSGHPQNFNAVEKTYLTVEYFDENINKWKVIATDANWETKFIWQRTGLVFGESQATIIWEIPFDTLLGIYRIRHFGASKNIFQKITPYIGVTSAFKVID